MWNDFVRVCVRRGQLRQSGRYPRTRGVQSQTSLPEKVRRSYFNIRILEVIIWKEKFEYRPPMKCLPLKYFTNGFGAVRLTRAAGWKKLPTPSLGGPLSISHDDGASTEVTGTEVVSRARMTAGNGSRTSPKKLKPVLEFREMSRLELAEWTNQKWHQPHDQSS